MPDNLVILIDETDSLEAQYVPKMKIMLDCGRLREARVRLGLSESDIRRRLHLSKTTVWRCFKTGECGMTTSRKVARLLNLDLAGLWIDARTGLPWKPGERTE